MENVLLWQWLLVIASSVILYLLSPFAATREGFFKGADAGKSAPGFWLLTFSLVISWLFAKSIANAANLGLGFGFVGGVAYAMYYFSFLVAGLVIYKMRKQGGYSSLHAFLRGKFGAAAVLLFSLVISFRLLNEVWSNTAVIGSYFGAAGSPQYIASVLVFTGLTLAYALKGGLRSSLVTDMIQMLLFGVLLFVILGMIIPRQGNVASFVTSGSWTMAGGLNLLLAAALQVFSYPFHDPVMTDRGFIADEKTTLKSFIAATFIGFFCILLFSFVGIHGATLGVQGQAAVEVSKTFGVGMMLLTNFIMITSAASTLDSTFSSVAKLAVVDLESRSEKRTVSRGRWVMIIAAVGGSLPLVFAPEIISATTISGTMVLGLAPVFLFWKMPAPALSFHLALLSGVIAGLMLVFGLVPETWLFSSGKYADLLAVNVYGSVAAFTGFLVPAWLYQRSRRSEPALMAS